jgi:hypothetical protein
LYYMRYNKSHNAAKLDFFTGPPLKG